MEKLTELQMQHLQELAEAFDEMCHERHAIGAKEYGSTSFLQNDVIGMMMEELADTANYCRYQFIKMALLQERLNDMLEEIGDEEEEVELGAKAFRSAGEGWNRANSSDPTD